MTTGNSSDLFGGTPVTTSIVSYQSTSGEAGVLISNLMLGNYPGPKVALSGAVTADTLKTALSITGKGFLTVAAVASADATSRTLRVKLTLDGVVVFDNTATAALAAEGLGVVAVGNATRVGTGTGGALQSQPNIYFKTSCLFEFASSLTETDKQRVYYAYNLTA